MPGYMLIQRHAKKRKAGRPRLIGVRLPNLQQVLASRRTHWKRVAVENWYGQTMRTLQYASATAIWYHGGFALLPIRWVLIRDPQQRFYPVALLCTDPRIKSCPGFLLRWRVEVTFQEVRAHLGFETQRQWSNPAIARTNPILLALFSLVTLLASRLTKRRSFPVSLGTAKLILPSPLPWPWCAVTIGSTLIFSYPSATPSRRKSRAPC